MPSQTAFVSDVPARLDRLPWARFHWLIVTALGITWILDGLEVTLVGSLSGVLTNDATLGLSNTQIGLAGSAYIAGAVIGALVFGDLTDRFGRKKLFTITVGVYLLATIATGFSWDFWSFILFRALTGAGIGGEYAAINSAIQEFIPARHRGYTDLAINGSFWVGAAIGAIGSLVVLDPAVLPIWLGWRLAFIIGGMLAIIVVFLRQFVPESPRWLMIHGRNAEAEKIIGEIEARVVADTGIVLAKITTPGLRFFAHGRTALSDIIKTLFVSYPKRTVLGITLMATQAFCYNAIFFTYALILTNFYGIAPQSVGWFLLPFAFGNFMGPLLLGRFFDTIGRKPMIALTYGLSGVLMALTGYLFAQGVLSATGQTIAWTINFFFASCGASAAYLTVGESFPLEMRARAIALFYAFGTALGGIAGPAVFGALIDTGSRGEILWGYLFGGGLMVFAALVELIIGIAAERKPLEDVAAPLSLWREP
ncbi:MAG TPA: MFS transporter [Rhizomicrobium sp.]|jgi:MFS family permease|nr:MFS transporter [Rhizomicrobium sp.]